MAVHHDPPLRNLTALNLNIKVINIVKAGRILLFSYKFILFSSSRLIKACATLQSDLIVQAFLLLVRFFNQFVLSWHISLYPSKSFPFGGISH